jgi:hypothetical protein
MIIGENNSSTFAASCKEKLIVPPLMKMENEKSRTKKFRKKINIK